MPFWVVKFSVSPLIRPLLIVLSRRSDAGAVAVADGQRPSSATGVLPPTKVAVPPAVTRRRLVHRSSVLVAVARCFAVAVIHHPVDGAAGMRRRRSDRRWPA